MSTERPCVRVVSASPLWRAGAVAALATLQGIDVHAAAAPDEDADAFVLHAAELRDAMALSVRLPAARPIVFVAEPGGEGEGADAWSAVPWSPVGLRGPAGTSGAVGLLAADAGPGALRAAVRAVLEGLSVTDHLLASASAWRAAVGQAHEALTPREMAVFELMSKGLSNKEIGGVLGISAHTAKFHVGQILAKVDASTRAEAVSAGLRMGLIGL